jgi:hypothetical protein
VVPCFVASQYPHSFKITTKKVLMTVLNSRVLIAFFGSFFRTINLMGGSSGIDRLRAMIGIVLMIASPTTTILWSTETSTA